MSTYDYQSVCTRCNADMTHLVSYFVDGVKYCDPCADDVANPTDPRTEAEKDSLEALAHELAAYKLEGTEDQVYVAEERYLSYKAKLRTKYTRKETK